MAKASTKKKPSTKAAPAIEGEVLDVVRALLEQGRNTAALDVVRQLAESNGALASELAKVSAEKAELERRLARIDAFRRKNEGISSDQLLLFLNELTGEIANDAESGTSSDDDAWAAEMIAANEKLRETSEPDAEPEPTTPKPAPQRIRPTMEALRCGCQPPAVRKLRTPSGVSQPG